ncbi:hypothetical protein WCP94_000131 (plasmid) [Bilophila wadsworthia]
MTDFLFEIKPFYFSILQFPACYFSDKRTYKKRMLEGQMVTQKNSYSKYAVTSIHPYTEITGCYPIPFPLSSGEALPCSPF